MAVTSTFGKLAFIFIFFVSGCSLTDDSSGDSVDSSGGTTTTIDEAPIDPEFAAVENRLTEYITSINERRPEDARAVFTEEMKARISLSELKEGTVTSAISKFNLSKVDLEDQGSLASAYASSESIQEAEFGQFGQECSVWEFTYTMKKVDQVWFIDRATALDGFPIPCLEAEITPDDVTDETAKTSISQPVPNGKKLFT